MLRKGVKNPKVRETHPSITDIISASETGSDMSETKWWKLTGCQNSLWNLTDNGQRYLVMLGDKGPDFQKESD